jgi:hypothetical protein
MDGWPLQTRIWNLNLTWCRGRGSNPHVPFGTADFKSAAYTCSATPARYLLKEIRSNSRPTPLL